MIETKKILQNEGDCCVAIVNGDYKVLVRIDDKNMQITAFFTFTSKI